MGWSLPATTQRQELGMVSPELLVVSPELLEAWLTSQSVRRPDRVADLFAPGFRLDGL